MFDDDNKIEHLDTFKLSDYRHLNSEVARKFENFSCEISAGPWQFCMQPRSVIFDYGNLCCALLRFMENCHKFSAFLWFVGGIWSPRYHVTLQCADSNAELSELNTQINIFCIVCWTFFENFTSNYSHSAHLRRKQSRLSHTRAPPAATRSEKSFQI